MSYPDEVEGEERREVGEQEEEGRGGEQEEEGRGGVRKGMTVQ